MNISAINIYPIKSLKGIALQESVVEKRGLQYDRRWMLTDPEGIFLTQREVPKMAAVSVEIADNGVMVSAEGFEPIVVPFEPDLGERNNVVIWNSTVPGEVYRGEVSEWFSDVLSKRCRLVKMPDQAERHVSERFDTGSDTVSFADGYPLLLVGEASLEELNRRIERNSNKNVGKSADAGETPAFQPLPMNRFRPNVVVTGANPFEEDRWARIKIGEAEFRVVKPCERCVITTVDQALGEFDGKEPLKTLASFRMAKDVFPGKFEAFGPNPTAVLFGENLIPATSGATISIDDYVEVVEFRF